MPVHNTRNAADQEFERGLAKVMLPLRKFTHHLAGAEGEDLLQETLTRAWENRHQFTPGTSLAAWIFTIARHLHYSAHKRRSRHMQLDPEYAERTIQSADGRAQVESRSELSHVATCLTTLTEPQVAALLWIACEGLHYADIADRQQCDIGTVKSRVSRGRRELKRIAESGMPVPDIHPGRLARIVEYLKGVSEAEILTSATAF